MSKGCVPWMAQRDVLPGMYREAMTLPEPYARKRRFGPTQRLKQTFLQPVEKYLDIILTMR